MEELEENRQIPEVEKEKIVMTVDIDITNKNQKESN